MRVEQGEDGLRDLAEALALLRHQGGRCAAYWRCPCCDARLMDARAYVQHVQVGGRVSVAAVGSGWG